MRTLGLSSAASIMICLSLTACGGGDAALQFPVAAPVATFLSQPSTHSLDANVNSVAYQLTTTYTPRAEEMVPTLSSSPLRSHILTVALSNSGVTTRDSAIMYYSVEPFQFWGEAMEISSGRYGPPVAITDRGSLPESASVGDSGLLGRWSSSYEDENGATVNVSSTMTWRLQRAGSDTAWLCFDTREQDYEGVLGMDRCLHIDRSGNVRGYQVDLITPLGNIAFR